MDAIGRGFRNILNFQGRDRRSQFWPYVAVVVCMTFATYAILSPIVMFVLFRDVNTLQYSSVNGEILVVDQQMQMEAAMQQMLKPVWGIMGLLVAFMLANVTLLAAAVSRRLHDRGLSGWWASIVPALMIAGMAMFFALFMNMQGFQEPTPAFLVVFLILFALMALYNISLIVLIVFLCLKGKTGPNRYGPEPV